MTDIELEAVLQVAERAERDEQGKLTERGKAQLAAVLGTPERHSLDGEHPADPILDAGLPAAVQVADELRRLVREAAKKKYPSGS